MKRPSVVWPEIVHEIDPALKALEGTSTAADEVLSMIEGVVRNFGRHVPLTSQQLAEQYNIPAAEITDEVRDGMEAAGKGLRHVVLSYQDAVKLEQPDAVEEGLFKEKTGDVRAIAESYLTFIEDKKPDQWSADFRRGYEAVMQIEEPEIMTRLRALKSQVDIIEARQEPLHPALKAAKTKIMQGVKREIFERSDIVLPGLKPDA